MEGKEEVSVYKGCDATRPAHQINLFAGLTDEN